MQPLRPILSRLRRTVPAACALGLALLTLGGCDPGEPPDERIVVRIFVVSELEEVVNELRHLYTQDMHDRRVELSGGDTQSLALQAAAGDKPDLLITNDTEVFRNLIPPARSVTPWLADDMVVISSDADASMSDFTTGAEPVAIAMETLPAGAETRLALQVIDAWSSVELRAVRTQTVDEVVSRVRSGDARFGVAYTSTVASAGGDGVHIVSALRLPNGTAITYAAGAFSDEGRDFSDWMRSSPEAGRIAERAGFRLADEGR